MHLEWRDARSCMMAPAFEVAQRCTEWVGRTQCRSRVAAVPHSIVHGPRSGSGRLMDNLAAMLMLVADHDIIIWWSWRHACMPCVPHDCR